MKRKLCLFLALCMMLGNISPAMEVQASTVAEAEVQDTEETEDLLTETPDAEEPQEEPEEVKEDGTN